MSNFPVQYQGRQIEKQQNNNYALFYNEENNKETNFYDYVNILKRRKKWIVFSLSITIIIAVLSIFIEKTLYKSTTTLLIDNINPNVIPIQEIIEPENSSNFYSTQYEIIKSRAVVEVLVDTLKLDKILPEEELAIVWLINTVKSYPKRVLKAMLGTVKDSFSEPSLESSMSPDELHRLDVITELQKHISVVPRPNTKLVDVTLQGYDPVEIIKHVNMLADIYLQQNLESKLDSSRKAISWLKEEAESLREKTEKAETVLENFKAKKGFIPPDELGRGQSTALQRLDRLNTSYVEANTARIQLQTQIAELKDLSKKNIEDILDFPAIASNQLINSLKTKFFDLRVQSSSLANKYTSKHPQIAQINAGIEETSRAIRTEIQNMVEGLQKEYNILFAKEKVLERELEAQKAPVFGLSENTKQYNTLKRGLDIDKDLHLTVSKRLAETTLTAALTTNNVRIIERALKSEPVSLLPKKIALTIVLGLCLGVGLAFIAEYLDKKFRNADEVERYLALPFLGVIPHQKGARRGRKPTLVTLQEPDAHASEAYRTVRTWLQLVSQQPMKSLLVTSATPEEGKTTTTANLGVSFAQLGWTVLLVDTDLRRPALHRAFGLHNRVGLTDILLRKTDWHDVIQRTSIENLKLLPTGSAPANPVELLSTHAMKEFVASVKNAFDLVLFDAPVVLSIPDVAILAPKMDAVLLVHCPTKGDKVVALQAKKLLERTGVTLLGVIFNNVHQKAIRYYNVYQYQSYYQSGPSEHKNGNKEKFIDMIPVENEERWIPKDFNIMNGGNISEIRVEKSSSSRNITITVHKMFFRNSLAEEEADRGFCFLVLDVVVVNEAEVSYTFNPGLTTLYVNSQNGYARALASIMALPGIGEEDNRVPPTLQVYHYDALTSRIAGGMAGEEDIAAKGMKRGLLVYRVPVQADGYIFEYASGDIQITIPFGKS